MLRQPARTSSSTPTQRARLKFDVDGAPVEEWITAVSMAQTSPSGDGNGGRCYDNRAIMLMSMRAPASRLEASDDPKMNPSSVEPGSWTPMEHVQASP